MSKLKLENIKKTYRNGETIHALRGISIAFRKNEFVAILGPSGCGKTTLLNIVGGLDQYDSGDLVINGLSTKQFRDGDWDAYRNHSIGFVFQTYNLIAHQTVLQNVEIAMTLSGVSSAERKRRAIEALAEVGLADQIKKKPNQLSGGQMQRVAIARALVNDPDIILADEPTGALDSRTSVQIMEILKEISATRLVIMVTHNGDLADKYSNRIVRLLDGEVQSDSNPVGEDKMDGNAEPSSESRKPKKTAMSLSTATSLSFRNLLTKKGRTIITAFAGSIGIIGVALVLALSSGLNSYMGNMQTDMLAGFPITISVTEQNIDRGPNIALLTGGETVALEQFTDSDIIYSYDKEENQTTHTNQLTADYLEYISAMETALPGVANTVSYSRGVNMNLLSKAEDTVTKYETIVSADGRNGLESAFGMGQSTYWQEMPDNEEFILSQYDLIGENSRLPSAKNEIALVVDEYNRLDKAFFEKLGLTSDSSNYKLSDFIGKTMIKVVLNDDFYAQTDDIFTAASATEYAALYENESGIELTIVGILRIREDAASSYLSQGLVYTTALTDFVVEDAHNSEIAIAQSNSDKSVLTGAPFMNESAKDKTLLALGVDTTPTGINIYPKDFASKDSIKEYLDAYNDGKTETNQVIYSDMAESISSMTGTMISTVSMVLIAFACISLLVSTIMIAIITYVSVIERTKEIGILRSVGARKKDISRVFNAEALIIGLTAGLLGVSLAYLLCIPINALITSLLGIAGIASLSLPYAAILVVGSMALTLVAGFIPSRMAAKKDPVEALRTE